MTTGIKDLDLKILSELDDASLLNFCQTSTYGKKLCENETFWFNRTLQKYGKVEKNPKRTWKNLYLKLAYYLDKYTESKSVEELAKTGMQNLDLIKIILSFITDKETKRIAIGRGGEESAKRGDMELTKFFIKEKTKNKLFDSYDYHWPLLYAIESGNKELVYYLVKKSKELFNVDVALQYAAENNDEELINFFISEGADNWDRALNGAAKYGNKDLVDFFIEKGANDWNFALNGAAEGGHENLVGFFIEKGANDWNYGLFGAAIGGHRDLVDFFIEKGADELDSAMADAITSGKPDMGLYLYSLGKDASVATGLSSAALVGNKELIDFFIEEGANNWEEALDNAKYSGYKNIIRFFENKIKG